MTLNFTPRPSQQNIFRYTGGRLGIAAVPGAGKTHILSALAKPMPGAHWAVLSRSRVTGSGCQKAS